LRHRLINPPWPLPCDVERFVSSKHVDAQGASTTWERAPKSTLCSENRSVERRQLKNLYMDGALLLAEHDAGILDSDVEEDDATWDLLTARHWLAAAGGETTFAGQIPQRREELLFIDRPYRIESVTDGFQAVDHVNDRVDRASIVLRVA
ncbi:hypothetical protein LTR43_011531, partial [Exophiala xenobiotica]